MRARRSVVASVVVAAGAACVLGRLPLLAQRGGMFQGSADDPAIAYSSAPLNNAVSRLEPKLRDGSVSLVYEGRSGYLRSALSALGIPIDSQALVFSQTSFQRKRIGETNPRALFFNDRVALGWVRDGELIEVAAQDATQGIVFYTLEQRPAERPEFRRVLTCLACHMSGDTLGVPGLLMFSTTAAANSPPRSAMIDHRMPLASRWGGWYVTGKIGSVRHRGNEAAALATRTTSELGSMNGLFDGDGYQAMSSDIAALLVLSHQIHMTNLLTRAGWEARAADPALHAPFMAAPGEAERIAQMMAGVAAEVVDYLLFVDEAPLANRVQGTSGFAERFAATGPRDTKGRSLHDLDLTRRLLKYPCSYLIYSEAFDSLPPAAKDPIYRRMWKVLSGADAAERYRAALPLPDRKAIVEILKETKSDLPGFFREVSR